MTSIILPCRNEVRHIEACLRSVLGQECPEGGLEIIVADGASDDGTRGILEKMEAEVRSQRAEVGGPSARRPSATGVLPAAMPPPLLRVIDNPGRIVSKGLNAAVRAARGGIIVRMDAHTEYAPDYVRRCVEELERTGADNVGGPARTKADTLLQRAVAAAYHSKFAVGGARFHEVEYEGWVDTVTYGCWRKESFERFGYFDEELVRNQDDEHNLRITRGGGKIWQSPKIKSWYRPRGSLAALFKQYMQYGYWKVRVIQKHRLPASWRHLVPGAFVLFLILSSLSALLGVMLDTLLPATSGLRPLTSGLGALSLSALLFALGSYLLAVLAASAVTAWRSGWGLWPILPLVFPCYHFGYGWGFLRGLWSFVVLRRRSEAAFERLTR